MIINSNKPIVEFNNVGLQLIQSITLFGSLNFKILQNSCCLLVGATGSGKSTILKMIKGLIPYIIPHKVTGEIIILNELKNHKNFIRQSLNIGLLFQDVEMQFIGSTVLQDLAFGLENLGIPRKKMIKLKAMIQLNMEKSSFFIIL